MGRKIRENARRSSVIFKISVFATVGATSFCATAAQDVGAPVEIAGVPLASIGGASAVVVLIAAVLWSVLTSRRMHGSSLFNRLFVVVAITAGLFSAISSAIGFSLITSQESADFFRNSVLPPAFGVFVFCLAVAIWVGGAEFVRHRDWFRGMGNGFIADIAFFIERAIKLFIVVPVLALILFLFPPGQPLWALAALTPCATPIRRRLIASPPNARASPPIGKRIFCFWKICASPRRT